MSFKLILGIGCWGIYCEIAFRWLSLGLTDNDSTLAQEAITWAIIDPNLCCHVVSLSHNELIALKHVYHLLQFPCIISYIPFHSCLLCKKYYSVV